MHTTGRSAASSSAVVADATCDARLEGLETRTAEVVERDDLAVEHDIDGGEGVRRVHPARETRAVASLPCRVVSVTWPSSTTTMVRMPSHFISNDQRSSSWGTSVAATANIGARSCGGPDVRSAMDQT